LQLQSKISNLLLSAFFWLFLNSYLSAQSIQTYTGSFPVPPHNKNMLFYLQRTVDVNTVIYEINYMANGEINKTKPVKVYWIDYANAGKISPLTYVQNKFAYGIAYQKMDGHELIFKMNIVSFKKITLYLKRGTDGFYQTYIEMNGKQCVLTNILVNIIGGTYMRPHISTIELFGKEIRSGDKITEIIKP